MTALADTQRLIFVVTPIVFLLGLGLIVFSGFCCGRTGGRVKDQGIGIPLADQPHLFEDFHRSGNVGNIPGTGLGLAFVKKAVALQRGRITFTSVQGVGTSFRVSLPLGIEPVTSLMSSADEEHF